MQTRHSTFITCSLPPENLDGTIIATAMPQMARSLNTIAVSLHIGITAYSVKLAILFPVSGWIYDRFSSRTVFTFAIALFTLGAELQSEPWAFAS